MRENKYVALKVDGKRIDEHRLVWMKHFGKIPEGYVIHHKNGIKYDNRIENLELMSRAQHTNHHRPEYNYDTDAYRYGVKKRAELRKIHSPEGYAWCTCCKRHLLISDFHKNRRTWNGLHNECKSCRANRKSKS